MRITADTNILVRAFTLDNPVQAAQAKAMLSDAQAVAISPQALCELFWVLRRAYKVPAAVIENVFMQMLDTANLILNRPAVEAGLAALRGGADFADGVIAQEGHWLGGEIFCSFDKQAVQAARAQGLQAKLMV